MQKILKIVLAIISLAGVFFLARIMITGDVDIKAAYAEGDSSLVESMLWVAYIVLVAILVIVVLFILKNLFTNTATLKNTLMSIGLFLLVGVISYVMATGVETPMKDGEILSEGGSKLVGTGLYMFYFLAIIAVATMLFSGIKKIIK